MISSATFSPCGTYRYRLTRQWAEPGPLLAVIGLNPSTADETEDDPTIRRCISFAKDHGYVGLVMLNLFAYRSTDPKRLKLIEYRVGPDNDAFLRVETLGRDVLCCWGTNGALYDRGDKVVYLLQDRDLYCLGTTKNGHPKHPLYLKKTEQLRPYPS